MRYSNTPLTANQVRSLARRMAREAGLDRDTADAVAHRVVERLVPHRRIEDVIHEEIQKHAQP